MKIVVNRCYGGYGLSLEAMDLYYKKKLGKQVYHFKDIGSDYKNLNYIPIDNKDSSLFSCSFTTPDPNKIDKGILWKEYYANSRPEPRNCPFLVEVVEELGSKRASGSCGKLEIVEIPDDVNWEVTEYDGLESVEEVHRRW